MVINDIQKSLNTSENIRVQLVSSLRRIEAIAESQNVMQNMSLETMYKALGPMRGAFGGNWVRHQVPGDMRKRWIDKRQKANDSGEQAWPLIAYADFADYAIIITKSDNWKVVFEEVFLHKVSVQESLRRLYPIRICTMHSRVITQDDELYFLVETKRILSAMEMDS